MAREKRLPRIVTDAQGRDWSIFVTWGHVQSVRERGFDPFLPSGDPERDQHGTLDLLLTVTAAERAERGIDADEFLDVFVGNPYAFAEALGESVIDCADGLRNVLNLMSEGLLPDGSEAV